MAQRFNPPPSWPQPPLEWAPPADWQPDPRWGPAPTGWAFWVNEPAPAVPPTAKTIGTASGSPRLFISYRRADCQPQANGLYDGLAQPAQVGQHLHGHRLDSRCRF